MPKVFLDIEKIKRPNSGLGQFGLHLSKNIIANVDDNFVGVYIPKENFGEYKTVERKEWKSIHKLTKVAVEASIWHSFHQEAVYFPKNKKIKKVLTIHDLNFLEKYKGAKRSKQLNRLQKLVSNSDAVTYISNFTKEVANQYLDIPKNVISKVIYNGIAINQTEKAIKPSWIKDCSPFLFTIGIVGEKKNFHTLIEMMNYLPDLKLYICGEKSSNYAEKIADLISQNKLQDRVYLNGKVSESEKKWLYKNCAAFVFPSKNEGFGLPVVEAMSYGKPLVISSLTSLPEIGGDLASYFSSFNAKDMAKEVKEAINNHTLSSRDKLIERSQQFDWSVAAYEYIEIYKSLL